MRKRQSSCQMGPPRCVFNVASKGLVRPATPQQHDVLLPLLPRAGRLSLVGAFSRRDAFLRRGVRVASRIL